MKQFLSGSFILMFVVMLGIPQAHAEDEWRYSLTPYIWLSTLSGELKYDIPPSSGGSPNVDSGSNSAKLESAFMLTGEVRKGKWSLFGDFIYLRLSSENAKTVSVNLPGGGYVPVIDAGTRSGLKGSLVTLAPGYNIYSTPQLNMDMFGGVRYLDVSVDANWRITGPVGTFPAVGSINQNVKLWDGIIGARGRINFDESKWSLPYYADIGTGLSSFTWQAIGGVSYAFSWGDVKFSYRHLAYNLGSDKLLQNISLSGPALGATFHF